MWLWAPRITPATAAQAAAIVGPAVLVGALANALMVFHLTQIDFAPLIVGTEPYYAALETFKSNVELVNIGFFVIFGLLTAAALHVTEDALRGMYAFAVSVLFLLSWMIYRQWDLSIGLAETRLGTGIAFWGIGWVLLMLHLMALLRVTPHRRWTWVTGGVAFLHALATLLTLIVAFWLGPDAISMVGFTLGLAAVGVVVARRRAILDAWAYRTHDPEDLPEVDRKRVLLVALYGLATFALIGAEYVHHFAYTPRFEMSDYLLMAAATPVGVILFGALSERGGRRTLLYGAPILAGVALLAQNGLAASAPVVIAEGLLLGSIPFLFQYLAEASRLLSRGSVFLFSMGAVSALGLGGSFIAQFRAWTDLPDDRILLLQFAVMILALVLAPQLPETRPQISEDQELEDYLELARRVHEES